MCIDTFMLCDNFNNSHVKERALDLDLPISVYSLYIRHTGFLQLIFSALGITSINTFTLVIR